VDFACSGEEIILGDSLGRMDRMRRREGEMTA